jgi:N4-gp56 family major capsid protein
MAINTTTSISNQYQNYFSKQLLDHAVHNLNLNDYAKMADLPRGMGAKAISFFRPVTAASANVQSLTEGTPISTFTDLTYTKVDVTLAQIGEAMSFTDILSWTSLLNVMKDGVVLLGEDCALKADDLTLAALCHATTGLTKRYSGGAASWAALAALTNDQGKFQMTDGLDAVTALKIAKAPRKNGAYIGIVGPQISRDLQRDPEWIGVSTYSAARQIFKGEAGELYGVRYVENTNPWGEDADAGAEGTRVTSGAEIWVSIFTGKDAYGVVKLAGGSHASPQIIINDKPDKSDPLNQKIIVGWKAFYAAAVLNAAFGIALRSRTLYS